MSKLFKPLSDVDMRRALPNAHIMRYRDLKKQGQLPALPLVLLYEQMPGLGHWVVVLRTPEGIEHFDSYGLKPDGERSFTPTMMRAKMGMDQPHLVKLLLDTMEPVAFNDIQLQSKKLYGSARIATCGRWCVLRARLTDLTSKQFADSVLGLAKRLGITPDELVTLAV